MVAEARRWSNWVFAGLFAVAVLLFARIILPFLMPVLLGGFLVILFMPLHEALSRWLNGRCSWAAGLSTLTVLLLLLLPLTVTGWLVVRELLWLTAGLQEALERVDLRDELLASLPRSARRYVQAEGASGGVEQALAAAAGAGATFLQQALQVGAALVTSTFLMLVAMYYLFLDGRRLLAEFTRMVPLDRRYVEAFSKEFTDVAYAVAYGNTVTAFIQGLLGALGMVLVGVPHAVVWGAVMTVAALVPVVGTALVWLPVGGVLLLTGQTGEGLFLLVWGCVVVASADNYLRPRLVGSRMMLHPLLAFLAMFGGVAVFGMMGVLLGPLIAALFMAMVRIYRRDFLKLEPLAPPATVPAAAPLALPCPAPSASAGGAALTPR